MQVLQLLFHWHRSKFMMTTIRSQRTNTRNLLHPSLAERANVVLGCSGSDDHGTVKAFASMPLQMLCNQPSPALRYTLWRLKLVKPRITISSVFEWLLHTPFDGSHPSKCNHRMMIITKKKTFFLVITPYACNP